MTPAIPAPSFRFGRLRPRQPLSTLPNSTVSSFSIPIMATSSSLSTPLPEPQAHRPPLRILVCGGGVIGACTAYFLSHKSKSANLPAQITLIEKSSIACAASGKAGGFLALDWCDDSPLSSLARASFNLHRSLALQLHGPENYGYRPLNTLSLPIVNTNKPSSASPPRSSSLLPSWVDGPTAGGPKTIGTVETTAQVHPQLFTRTLVDVATKEYGLQVLIGEVEKLEVEGGKVTGAVVREGKRERIVEADAVVLALGPWSSRSAILSSLFNVSGLKAHSIVLRPPEPSAITPHALFLSYQDSPGAKVLDPEVYPRPTGTLIAR